MSVEQLNTASVTAFVEAMAPFFEGAPRFLAQLAAARPYRDEQDLFRRARSIAAGMREEDQIQLVDAHPRIGTSAGLLSEASLQEQGVGGAPARVQHDLDRLNAAYEARFGFRCIVFMAGRSRADIVPVVQARLGAERGAELRAAVADVVAIAQDRWGKAE